MKRILAVTIALLFFASCRTNDEGSPHYEGAAADSSGYAGGSADTASVGAGSKLVKTAALQVQVRDVHSGTHALAVLAESMGGALRHQHLAATETAMRTLKQGRDSVLLLRALAPTASLVIRVPSARLNEFLFAAGDLASFVQGSDYDVDDRTLDYQSAQERADARRRFLESAATSRKVTGSTTALAIRDEEIGERLEQRGIDDAVRYSTVRVELTQPPLLRREVIVNGNLDDYNPPFGSRLADALLAGWDWAAQLLLAAAHLWVFLLAAILTWGLLRNWGKSRSRVQPAK